MNADFLICVHPCNSKNAMKKIIFPILVISLILIGVMIVIPLISLPQNPSNGLIKTEAQTLQQKDEKTTENSQDVAIVKKFAESYEPKSTNQSVIPSPPEPSEKVLQSILNLENNKSREHEKYVVLVFLRLYRFHIENFKQSYELGRDNLLTKEFFRIIQSNDYQKAELMPSYLAHTYVKENAELLKYNLIEKEMERIEKAGEKIKKELDKTTKE